MANLTKEQRAEKEALLKAEMEAQIKAELEVKIRAEMEKQIRKEYEEKLSKKDDSNVIEKESVKTNQKPKKIPLDILIPVTSNFKGVLNYTSNRITGYTIKWDGFGSTEYIELAELVSMRNSARRFFEDNWIVIEDTDEYAAMQIYDFLKVAKYYKNVFTPETIDSLFEKDPSDMFRIISTLSQGMKDTIAVRAKEKIDSNEFDSTSKRKALSEALGITFNLFES